MSRVRYIGRADALSLLAAGSTALASLPQFAGYPLALATTILTAIGAGRLTWKQAQAFLDRTDIDSREGFILPSDELPDTSMGMGGLRFGYTRDRSLPLDIANTWLTRHTAIIGQSGVGKTTLGEYLMWQQMCRGGGILFIDAKLDAETRDKFSYMAKMAGREEDVYVVNVDDPDNSHTYNPILQGDGDEVASRLLNLLPSSENNIGADFYKQQANHALTVLVAAMKASGLLYHFGDLAVLLQSAQAIEALERMIRPELPEARALAIFLDQFRRRGREGEAAIDINKLKEVLGGMAGRIAMFAQGNFGRVFNTYEPQLKLHEAIQNNKLVYFMLPTMGKETAALNLGKMALSDLRTATYYMQKLAVLQRPNPPFLAFMDELGSYVMPGIARLFEQARTAGIALFPAFQSFANLSTVSPDFTDMIVQNTWNKIFFKFGAKDSPEYAAEIIGKTMGWQKTYSRSESESLSAHTLRTTPDGGLSEGDGIGMSWKDTEKHRVSPDQLKALGIGEAIGLHAQRMFHINTPMIEFPESIPTFQAKKHKTRIEPGFRPLNFEDRYRSFLMESSAA